MAAKENLLALKNQRPTELSNDATEIGGPRNTWSTAEYASFSFDPARGLVQDNTVAATAKVPARASELPQETGPAKTDGKSLVDTFGEVHEDEEADEKKDDLKEGDVDLDGDGDDDSVDLDLDDLTDDLDTIDLDEEEDEDKDKKDLDEEEDSDDKDDKKDLDEEESDDDEKKDLDEEDEDDKDKKDLEEGEIPPQFRKDGDGDGKKDLDKDGDDDDDDDAKEKKDKKDLDEEEESDDKPDFLKKKDDKEDVKESKIQPFKLKINFGETSKLFESNSVLTEEDKRQSRVLFESAVRTVAKDMAGQLRNAYQVRFNSLKSLHEAKVSQKVDEYLNYVVEQWVVDNKVPLRNQLRSKLTENFMRGIKSVFEANYVDIPAGKTDVVKALAENVKSLKNKLKLAEAKNVKLSSERTDTISRERKALVLEHKARLIAEAAIGVTPAERGKFSSAAKNVTFTNTKNFRKDLVTLREQYVVAEKVGSERPLKVPDALPLFENKDVVTNEVSDYIAAAARISS